MTTVRSIELPDETSEAYKFVREAVRAFPELYFSRLVVLGEGDSEEIALPRVLSAYGVFDDEASISVTPLGGRHVNHFWRLLSALRIPYVTLLDLDLGRFQGGWGRISYAAKQVLEHASRGGMTAPFTADQVKSIAKWDSDKKIGEPIMPGSWMALLESVDVFFSAPLDLDFTMLTHYSAAYGIDNPDDLGQPNESATKSVLGKKGRANVYDSNALKFFDAYHDTFKVASKPASHLEALSQLSDEALREALPGQLNRLVARIKDRLKEIAE